jgi:cholesterol transport system auxiliary component
MNNKVIALCNLMIVSMILSGCGPRRIAYNQRSFVLETSRNSPQQKTSRDVILDVKNFSIDTTFSTKSLVYRKGQSEYETDFYNQFLVKPDDMITEKTRSWLAESGLFKWVLEPGSYTDATHVLEGNITTLYGDFRDDSLPKASMKIRVFLVKLPEKAVVFTNTYESVSEFKDGTAGSLIEAFGLCLTNILLDLEKDLQKQL